MGFFVFTVPQQLSTTIYPLNMTWLYCEDFIWICLSSLCVCVLIYCSFSPVFCFHFPSVTSLPLLSLSPLLFSVSSLAAVPCWGDSNLNYVSQGPISLLPAVGISGLLISYQPVIGLRSPSPSDIPQIYDTPDSLRGGWGGRGWLVVGWFLLPACQHFTQQNVFLTT